MRRAASESEKLTEGEEFPLTPVAEVPLRAPLEREVLRDLRKCLEEFDKKAEEEFARNKWAQAQKKKRTPVGADTAGRLFEALQDFVVKEGRTWQYLETNYWGGASQIILRFPAHPKFELIHLVRWCLLISGRHKTANQADWGRWLLSFYWRECFMSYQKARKRPIDLRELAAVFRTVGLDERIIGDQLLRENRYVSSPFLRSEPERIWPYFAERIGLLEGALGLKQVVGCRDFNEMWDHLFEANFQSRPTRSFINEVATYCFFGRIDASDAALQADGTAAREQAMATAIQEQISARSAGGGPILVVTGGFHTVALPGLVGKGSSRPVPSTVSPESVQQALIRYSFQQLDALHGYSAGMPSPNYYNRLWREVAGGSAAAHSRVAVSFLVEIGAITRKKDMQVALSTADEIAALQHARYLATMRGHAGPTREDLLDGVRSCFVKGSMDAEGAVLMGLAQHVLTGNEIGNIPAGAGTPPIVASFQKEAERARLDISNSLKKQIALEIYRRENHRRTSRFMHSVSFLNVPFATLTAGPDFASGTGLERIHEHWQYSWSPMTEGALVEASVYGATIEEATANRLREAIARLAEEGQGRSAKAAVAMLIRACRMGLHRYTPQLLSLIASRISEEPSFVEAVSAANQLLLLWQSREPLQAHSLAEIPELLRACHLRACYLAPGLAQCPEDELTAALNSLSAMRELIAAAPPDLLDPEFFWQAISSVLRSKNQSHPPFSTICGSVAGLLYSVGRMEQQALDELVVGHLVGISDSTRRVGFLRGLLRTCREAAWQNLPLIHALDEIIGTGRKPSLFQCCQAYAWLSPTSRRVKPTR